MQVLPSCEWIDPPRGNAEALAKSAGVPLPIASLLVNRGLVNDPEGLARFLNPSPVEIGDPFAFPGAGAAADAIAKAIGAGGEILVFGDYDVDGVTATAIMADTISRMGGRARTFIPNRSEGYGLSDAAIARCLADGKPSLLVTVDCGITAGDAVRHFLGLGVEVVVTDHHIPDGSLPDGCVVVSTHAGGVPQTHANMCGAGVAFMVAAALTATMHPRPDDTGRRELAAWLDALSIATVADVVPLTGVNRAIVSKGLERLNRLPRPGLKMLRRQAFQRNVDKITSYHLGMILAPHINAAGRVADGGEALKMLLAPDDDTALEYATRLKNYNSTRRNATDEVFKQAEQALADKSVFDPESSGAVVAAGEGWTPGVVGIAAGRLCEKWNRPTVLITIDGDGLGKGSCRAPNGYNIHGALEKVRDVLLQFGGHSNAAGITIRAERIAELRERLSRACSEQVGAPYLVPSLEISHWLEAGDVCVELLEALNKLEPFGQGNPEPCWGLRGVTIKWAKRVGKDLATGKLKHLSLLLSREDGVELRAVWFNAAELEAKLDKTRKWDFAGSLSLDDYVGEQSIQMVVTDARPEGLY